MEIDDGVAFLNHPSSRDKTLAAKLSFLESKGFSESQIQRMLSVSGPPNTASWIGDVAPWVAIIGMGFLTYYLTGDDNAGECVGNEESLVAENRLDRKGVVDLDAIIDLLDRQSEDIKSTISSTCLITEKTPVWAEKVRLAGMQNMERASPTFPLHS